MILHTGVDGGLHDLLATNVAATVVWIAFGINAAIYYTRLAIRRVRGRFSNRSR